MAAVAAHEATRTYDCKTIDCRNSAASPRGLHAYCPTCQTKRAATVPRLSSAPPEDSHVARLKNAMAAAKRLDVAEQKAREAGRELAAARTAHKEALIAMTAPHGVRAEAD